MIQTPSGFDEHHPFTSERSRRCLPVACSSTAGLRGGWLNICAAARPRAAPMQDNEPFTIDWKFKDKKSRCDLDRAAAVLSISSPALPSSAAIPDGARTLRPR